MNTLVNQFSVEEIIKILSLKGYQIFEHYNPCLMNHIGIRSADKDSNEFNDVMYSFYGNRKDGWKMFCYPITTDPGNYYREHKLNSEGTGILVPGQYVDCWILGKHKGEYDALVQRRPVKLFRDNNEDAVLDFDYKTVVLENAGVNIHRASEDHVSSIVGKWSAACQVFPDPEDYNDFMEMNYRQKKTFGNAFSYTLLEEKDFELLDIKDIEGKSIEEIQNTEKNISALSGQEISDSNTITVADKIPDEIENSDTEEKTDKKKKKK